MPDPALAVPTLTIGMPLFNNAATLRTAVDSLLAQSFQDFVLCMSDDGSSDDTVAIANDYCARDPRCRLIRQPVNLNYGNFRVLLQQATSEYFMFAAGDDRWAPTFVERCLDALRRNPSAVCAVSKVHFVLADGRRLPSEATAALVGDPIARLAAYLDDPADNSRMYGVFRTPGATAAFPQHDHHAYDWTFSAASLLHGDHVEVPEVLMFRDFTPYERYVDYARRDAPPGVHRLFPLARFTWALVVEKRMPLRWPLVRRLMALNIGHHLNYTRRFHPRYHRMATPVLARLRRLLRA